MANMNLLAGFAGAFQSAASNLGNIMRMAVQQNMTFAKEKIEEQKRLKEVSAMKQYYGKAAATAAEGNTPAVRAEMKKAGYDPMKQTFESLDNDTKVKVMDIAVKAADATLGGIGQDPNVAKNFRPSELIGAQQETAPNIVNMYLGRKTVMPKAETGAGKAGAAMPETGTKAAEPTTTGRDMAATSGMPATTPQDISQREERLKQVTGKHYGWNAAVNPLSDLQYRKYPYLSGDVFGQETATKAAAAKMRGETITNKQDQQLRDAAQDPALFNTILDEAIYTNTGKRLTGKEWETTPGVLEMQKQYGMSSAKPDTSPKTAIKRHAQAVLTEYEKKYGKIDKATAKKLGEEFWKVVGRAK